jgi:hypothetical protein
MHIIKNGIMRVVMSDAEWKRAQTEPLQGESDTHFKGKSRLRHILQRCGYFAVFEKRYQVSILGNAEPIELRCDVYGITPDRQILLECNGPGGHKTRQAYNKDNSKATLIREQYGIAKSDYITFHFKSLVGRNAWSDKEIVEQMGIDVNTLDHPIRKWV